MSDGSPSHCPTLQGATSTTWHRPPLDGSLTLPELFKYHAEHSSTHPLFIYPNDLDEPETVFYPESYRAMRRAANLISGHHRRLEEDGLTLQSDGVASTIGILAVADTITYFTLMVGVMLLGHVPFPISTRNSAIAVAHLVRKTEVRQLFVSEDPAMQRLSQEAVDMLAKDGLTVELFPMPRFEHLYNEDEDQGDISLGKLSKDQTALILHSSGSTAFPKPIKITHFNFLQWGTLLYHGEADICDKVMAIHSLPMFHAMGSIMIPWTVCSGTIMGCFKPSSPPVYPNPDNFMDGIIATRSNLIYCVPAHIEAWARNPAYLPIMQKMIAIVFAGAPVNKEIGDELVKAGVKLTPFYGATEFGSFSMFIPSATEQDEWEYMKMSPHLHIEFAPQKGMPNIFEPIILSRPPYAPNVFNAEINGVPAYRTNDLLQRHPTKHQYYRVYGRADDQLVLLTGEKTNPAPLETMMQQDPHVAAALMFGRSRFQNGVIIQPVKPFDPCDETKLAELRNKVWPTIEKVNEYAPSHSRLFKEMILVTHPSKPFEFTPKGTPRRQVCIDAYSAEIDAAYAAVKSSSQEELPPPKAWTAPLILEFVRAAVERVLKVPVRDEDNLFQQGCDSLQATWIRNTIIRALRDSSSVSVHGVSSTVVYFHPSIRALSEFIAGLCSKKRTRSGEPEDVEEKVQKMRELVHKYGKDFDSDAEVPHASDDGRAADDETVLLTGSTGRFGSHLLAVLLRDPNVDRVFALNRGSLAALERRQREAFKTWGLNVELLSSPKLTLLVADLSKENLGLQKGVYSEIQHSVTIIVHNAWKVDFNQTLSSFEPLVLGVRRLIDLALGCNCPERPRFIFSSSIAVLHSHPSANKALEVPISDPKVSVSNGYGESKWVAEELLALAAKDSGLRTTTIRIGQLSGDTHIGGWNVKEWVPALIAGGQVLDCIPERDEEVSWIPVDVAASALVEMATGPYEPILHLVSPRPVPWNTLLKPVADKLGVPFVAYAEWLSRLQALGHNIRLDQANHSTALRLLDFFQEQYFGDGVRLDTARAVCVSRTLKGMRALNAGTMLKSVDFWEGAGLLQVPSQLEIL